MGDRPDPLELFLPPAGGDLSIVAVAATARSNWLPNSGHISIASAVPTSTWRRQWDPKQLFGRA